MLLIDLHFLPSLEYFCVLRKFEEVVMERHEHFVKQSLRNRCYIRTASGVESVTVPLTGKRSKALISDIGVATGTRWRNTVWRTFESAYGKAPYFEHYAGELNSVLFGKTTLLFELNLKMLSFCLTALKWRTKVSQTKSYEQGGAEGMVDLRSVIALKKSFEERAFYEPKPYYQVFGNQFAPNLSIVDLLMCMGPEATRILDASAGASLNK